MIGCIGRSGPTGEQRRRGLLTTGLSRSSADLQNEQARGRRLFPSSLSLIFLKVLIHNTDLAFFRRSTFFK